jgi:3-phosphoshikimate 1-carboxyvinyltransferase
MIGIAGPAGIADPWVVEPAKRLRGRPRLPGDKSIGHRALLLALLADGASTISGASDGLDVTSTIRLLQALGAVVEEDRDDEGGRRCRVRSPGIDALQEPAGAIDCGNSGTTLRLGAGILAGQAMTAVLDGDASLRARPVARIIEPLRSMGAAIRGRRRDTLPPVTVVGRRILRPVDWTVAVPSAQVKSAILLAGLRAEGTTRVHEPVATRDHTERMLLARGVRVRSIVRPGGARTIEIEGGVTVAARDERVPADPSAAAFWLVAGTIHPDAELRLDRVDVNPTRRAAIDVLARMGADIVETHAVDARDGDAEHVAEPVADLVVRSSSLQATELAPTESAMAIDELPILALAATQARGRTRIRAAGELRVKESDRLAGVSAGLRALGAAIEVDGDDLVIDGPTPLHGAVVDAVADHRLAMTFAIAGLIAGGRTAITGASSVAISDPRFPAELERIRT